MTDYDKDHVDLKWSKPTEDGGSPITGYVIEKKDKYGDWEKAVEVPADKLTATVPDLIEGQPYEFRVRAVNAVSCLKIGKLLFSSLLTFKLVNLYVITKSQSITV